MGTNTAFFFIPPLSCHLLVILPYVKHLLDLCRIQQFHECMINICYCNWKKKNHKKLFNDIFKWPVRTAPVFFKLANSPADCWGSHRNSHWATAQSELQQHTLQKRTETEGHTQCCLWLINSSTLQILQKHMITKRLQEGCSPWTPSHGSLLQTGVERNPDLISMSLLHSQARLLVSTSLL